MNTDFYFANTEPNRISTSLAVAKCEEASKGLERDGYKPLMQNRAGASHPRQAVCQRPFSNPCFIRVNPWLGTCF
jgi:hypothetical protein